MKLEKDYAIIETLAEWELFNPDWKDQFNFDDINGLWGIGETIVYIKDGQIKITREQVKAKIIPRKGKGFFGFSNYALAEYFPYHYQLPYGNKKCDYEFAVNSLTINKTIGELKELWRWVNEKS